MKTRVNKLTYNVNELVELLGVSRPIAYDLVHSKGFPVINIGRRILIQSNP